jgi:aldehyde:ferredoxin oxidoreductase
MMCEGENMAYLYAGKILKIDLSNQKIKTVPTRTYAEGFLGGRGINIALLSEVLDGTTNPLGLENIIAFGTGPLGGTFFPGSGRVDVMSKSPVTGQLGNANMGGNWGPELKFAGYDHLVITGRSESPAYIHIENENVEIRDASHIWGKDTYETQAIIREELDDPEVKTVTIGPAGENLVVYASLHTNVGNAGARTGMGAVMGSKNLKAVSVRGTKGVKIADPEKFIAACTEVYDAIKQSELYEEVSKIGVSYAEYIFVLSGAEAGGDAHRTAPDFDSEGKTNFTKFWESQGYRRTGCFGCPVHCMENYNIEGIGATVISCELYPQMTWEVRNDDMLLFYECIRVCQQYGIDNTSASSVLAWLMELYEDGIITAEHTDGISMEWGNRDAILGMLLKIIHREGIGSALADGLDAAAEHLDKMIPSENRGEKSTKYYAMHVNNNPMFGINPRFLGQGLAYSIGRRSDCIGDLDHIGFYIAYITAHPDLTEQEKEEYFAFFKAAAAEETGIEKAGELDVTDGKAHLIYGFGLSLAINDLVGTCKWHADFLLEAVKPEHFSKALTVGLGKEITEEELHFFAIKMKNLERNFEFKAGRHRDRDTLPERVFHNNPVSRGPFCGLKITEEQLEKMKDEYYRLQGWDEKTGKPKEETLEKYGLLDYE